jgi:hypothetical protein
MDREAMEHYKAEFGKLMDEYRAAHNGEYPSLAEALELAVPRHPNDTQENG